jgi:hypothetical protein
MNSVGRIAALAVAAAVAVAGPAAARADWRPYAFKDFNVAFPAPVVSDETGVQANQRENGDLVGVYWVQTYKGFLEPLGQAGPTMEAFISFKGKDFQITGSRPITVSGVDGYAWEARIQANGRTIVRKARVVIKGTDLIEAWVMIPAERSPADADRFLNSLTLNCTPRCV